MSVFSVLLWIAMQGVPTMCQPGEVALGRLCLPTAMSVDSSNSGDLQIMETTSFQLMSNGELLVSINLKDGTIEYGPHYKPDAAAKEFWEMVKHYAPPCK